VKDTEQKHGKEADKTETRKKETENRREKDGKTKQHQNTQALGNEMRREEKGNRGAEKGRRETGGWQAWWWTAMAAAGITMMTMMTKSIAKRKKGQPSTLGSKEARLRGGRGRCQLLPSVPSICMKNTRGEAHIKRSVDAC
jgi:hypothetical protein